MIAVWLGIDVAFSKKKPLPVSVCMLKGRQLVPLACKTLFTVPPRGSGNRAALDETARTEFARATLEWIKKLERCGYDVKRIAIDAPSDYCRPGLSRRAAESALDVAGISCFATPTKDKFQEKITRCVEFLDQGGKISHVPNAHQLWMLVGFELFTVLRSEYECIETFPQAIIRELNCTSGHKSLSKGLDEQIAAVARVTGHEPNELAMALAVGGYGSRHDKLDAFMSAWVASLNEDGRKAFGEPPGDAIWVPKLDGVTG